MQIPEFNTFDGCPKCRLPADDTTGGLLVTVTFHHEPMYEDGVHPCADLARSLTMEQEEELEFGEHLCRRCARCGFSWVERVVRTGSVYDGLLPAAGDERAEEE